MMLSMIYEDARRNGHVTHSERNQIMIVLCALHKIKIDAITLDYAWRGQLVKWGKIEKRVRPLREAIRLLLLSRYIPDPRLWPWIILRRGTSRRFLILPLA